MEEGVFFQWSEKYLIGHDRIDQDHQFLFHQLQQAENAKPGDDNFYLEHQFLNTLLDFSHTHFMDEEALMRSIRFPHYEEHAACHHFLLQRTEDLLDRVQLGYTSTMSDIVAHLREWIGVDILTADIKIGLAIANRYP